jgi:hypothetical protein
MKMSSITVVGEIPREKAGFPRSLSAMPVKPTVHPRITASLQSSEGFRDLAKHLAYNIVSGFVEHDKGHLEKSVEAFHQVYRSLFPEIGELRTRHAAELYVDACLKQDEIEDHPGHSKSEIFEDPRWEDLKAILLQQTKILGIPTAYAENTTNYFRYHGVGNSRYLDYCLEADRIFTTAIIGNDYWAKILGAIYIICTECHDKHDSTGLEVGIEFATKYFETILKAKAAVQQRVLLQSRLGTFGRTDQRHLGLPILS